MTNKQEKAVKINYNEISYENNQQFEAREMC